jgi:hypothetical protein
VFPLWPLIKPRIRFGGIGCIGADALHLRFTVIGSRQTREFRRAYAGLNFNGLRQLFELRDSDLFHASSRLRNNSKSLLMSLPAFEAVRGLTSCLLNPD